MRRGGGGGSGLKLRARLAPMVLCTSFFIYIKSRGTATSRVVLLLTPPLCPPLSSCWPPATTTQQLVASKLLLRTYTNDA